MLFAEIDWLAWGERLGVPAIIIIAGGLFFWKGLWPFIVKQLDDCEKRCAKNSADFQVVLEKRDEEFGKVVTALSELRNAIAADRGKK